MRKSLHPNPYTLAPFSRASRRAFTLIELVVVVALISLMAVTTFVTFYGRRNADDITSAKQQLGAVIREAQSRSLSEDKNVAWGVHLADTTTTAPFYALFSSAYSTGTTAAYYRLPVSVGMILVPSGLAGYWPLDEGGGTTALDYSGNSNVGTWSGTKVGTSGYYSAGMIGKWSGTFDGSADYISVPSASSLNMGTGSFTISAWVKPSSSLSNYYQLIGKKSSYNGSNVGWEMWLDYRAVGVMELRVNDGSAGADLTPQPSPNLTTQLNGSSWVYLTWVVNIGNNVTFYLNGTNEGAVSISSMPGSLSNSQPVSIGGLGGSGYFPGGIDDLRIYNRALSATEISQLYAESADILFSELTGNPAASTSVELYSLAQFGLSSTISIAPTGEVSF